MVEFVGAGIGFSLTKMFIFSLGLLYLIDFKTRGKATGERLGYIVAGVVSLMVFLVGLIYAGKFAVDSLFLHENRDTAIRFLTMGIVFGLITFPFVLRSSTKFFIKV